MSQTTLIVVVAGALTALAVVVFIALLSDRGPNRKQD
jgi:hypothetical protein